MICKDGQPKDRDWSPGHRPPISRKRAFFRIFTGRSANGPDPEHDNVKNPRFLGLAIPPHCQLQNGCQRNRIKLTQSVTSTAFIAISGWPVLTRWTKQRHLPLTDVPFFLRRVGAAITAMSRPLLYVRASYLRLVKNVKIFSLKNVK